MTVDKKAYARTEVYLDPPAAQPKHMFVRIGDLIEERHFALLRLLDVGAASGAFVDYALQRFRPARTVGVEYDGRLVEEAKQRVPAGEFLHGDANRLEGVGDASFDAVTLTGTHSIFDDFRPSFGECLRVCAPGGRVIVTGIFNPYPVDAQIHWRYAGRFEDAWHPGYNLFSEQTVGAWLRQQARVARFAFHPFTLPFDLAPQADPIRSWTEPTAGGERILRNGIMPLPFAMLAIDLHA